MSSDAASERITLRRDFGWLSGLGTTVRGAWRKRWVKVVTVLLALPVHRSISSSGCCSRAACRRPNRCSTTSRCCRPMSATSTASRCRASPASGGSSSPIDEYPPQLINAFLAAEDRTFFSHGGIDYPGLVGAVFDYVSKSGSGERARGGSTITQQVAKIFFTGDEYSVTRKIREAFLARRIESALSKQQILELYLNQIFLGRNAYGVQAAARAYFDKDVDQLTLAESAYLAVLPKAPANYDPVRHPERALERRNWVLGEMARNGFITAAQRDAAIARAARHRPRRAATASAMSAAISWRRSAAI